MATNQSSKTLEHKDGLLLDFSDTDMWILELFFNVCIGIPLSVLGVVVNILNLLVLSRHNLKETTNIMLLSLSSLDLFYSFTSIFIRLPSLIKLFDQYYAITFDAFANVVVLMPNSVSFVITIFHVTAIAIERLIAVLFPFHVSRIFTPYRVKWMLLGLYLFGSVPVCPYYYRLTYKWIFIPNQNITIAVWTFTDFYIKNVDIVLPYVSYFINNTTTTIPIILILISGSLIIGQLIRQRSKETLSKASKQKKEMKVVKMLMTVCAVSFFILVPEYIIHTYLTYHYYEMSNNAFILITLLIQLLYQLNSCVNFFIYITMSSKFADTYKALVSSKFSKKVKYDQN
ncbi:G-protein coupled receptor daf-37-like [Physella acuta]|uniref:G-protein coupled receptor daf-37-like n=1 Tax=Physella acuta TaxID=109671 RepID=UPI0027DD34EE|nr:G-protein coupled receptor daf-37-like [Physella acuta]